MFSITNPSFFFPFFLFVPTLAIIISKYRFESTAKTTYLGNPSNVLIMVFLQFSQNCFIAVVHYWLRRLHIKFGLPTFFINMLMMGLYLEIFGFTLYDFENTRHNMQMVLPSTYVAYLGRFGMEQKVFHEFWSNIKGTKAHSNSASNIVKTTILDSPHFFIQMLVVLSIFIIFCIILTVCNWKNILDSVFTRDYLEKLGISIPQVSANPNLFFSSNIQLKHSEYFNIFFLLIHFLAFVDITIVSIILFSSEDFKARYFSTLPYSSSLILALSHFEFRPSKQTINNLTNLTRNFLPPGRFWIDTRDNPVYPEIHGDFEAFCAYNPQSTKCNANGAKLTELLSSDPESGTNGDNKKSSEIKNNKDSGIENKIKENTNESKDKENTNENKENNSEHSKRNSERRSGRRISHQLNDKDETDNKNDDILKPEELPNVLLLLYESFNPSTYLINKEFLEEHVKNPNALHTDTPFYNEEIMPFLHKFAKEEMITFSGMQTLGLPSFSGLHSILTQEPPSQTYMNIINGWQNDVDDIPSYFHMKGFRTLIVNANRFDFDGKQYWIYKKSKREEAKYRMNCLSSYGDSFNDTLQEIIGDYSFVPQMRKECSDDDIDEFLKNNKNIYDFPRWFDYAAAYYPTFKQAKAIGLDPNSVYEHPSISVSGDRIVAKEIEAHWEQQKRIMKNKGQNMPLFTLASSVDGHMPYSGYDKPEYYSKIDPSIKPHTESMRVARFLTVNKYTDHYFIEELVNWLKENDPNTIILFTGDHGTRDIPAKEKNQQFTENIKYDPKCIHESTGSDSFFYVTGAMTYLGKDERIRKAFGLDKLAGKTIKFTVDHGDMIYTAEEILQRLQGKKMMPTNRKSRNLVDMSLDLINENNDELFAKKIDESGWKSVSMVSHMVEYHNGMKMVRFHPGDIEGAHVYKRCVYPTGFIPTNFNEDKDKREFVVIREEKDEEEKKKDLDFVNEALSYLSAENYLGATNRIYNYKFRDEDCIKNQKCNLPEKLPDLDFRDGPFLMFITNCYILGEFILMLPILIAALFRVCCACRRQQEKKDFSSLLNNHSDGL